MNQLHQYVWRKFLFRYIHTLIPQIPEHIHHGLSRSAYQFAAFMSGILESFFEFYEKVYVYLELKE